MMEAGEGDDDHPLPVLPAAAAKSKRPDFSADAKYQRLVSVMGVDSVSALNEKSLQISDFRKRAAELWNEQADGKPRAPASFKSWEDVVSTLLTFADVPSPQKTAAAAAAAATVPAAADDMSPAAEQAAAEDIDESVADSVQVVQALLESPEAALDLDLDEAKMRAYTQALCKHADKLDEALRGKFEELAESQSTVEDVVKIVEVSVRDSNACPFIASDSIMCTYMHVHRCMCIGTCV